MSENPTPEQEKIGTLKFMSQVHRDEFHKRRDREWQMFFSLITFYVLAVAASYREHFDLANHRILIWCTFIVFALSEATYMWYLHRANRINRKLAEASEDTLIDTQSLAQKLNVREIISGLDNKDPLAQCLTKYEWLKSNWSWLGQATATLMFALASAFLITYPDPAGAVAHQASSAAQSQESQAVIFSVIQVALTVVGITIAAYIGFWQIGAARKELRNSYSPILVGAFHSTSYTAGQITGGQPIVASLSGDLNNVQSIWFVLRNDGNGPALGLGFEVAQENHSLQKRFPSHLSDQAKVIPLFASRDSLCRGEEVGCYFSIQAGFVALTQFYPLRIVITCENAYGEALTFLASLSKEQLLDLQNGQLGSIAFSIKLGG